MDAITVISALEKAAVNRRLSKAHFRNLENILRTGWIRHKILGVGEVTNVNLERMTISVEFEGGKRHCVDVVIAAEIFTPAEAILKV